VRLVVFDVDGVLTDSGLYVGRVSNGTEVEFKRFDIQDGLGIKFLMRAGIEVAFVSGRYSEATVLRAKELGVTECLQDREAQKLDFMGGLMERRGVAWDEVAMVADDLPDLPVFARVGLPVAVANAQPEILERAAWRTTLPGGHGAVREFCRALLQARGEWDRVIQTYVKERGGV
jgi:3-deoxy-D-manno-octulosonate 8-phosphate phosphatase (KDO 8-P phosphatase)